MASAVRQAAVSGAAVNAPAFGIYRRRRPDQTLAFQIVHDWLATWLAQQERGGVPGGVLLQRLGSALNGHWHYHVCVSDGVFTDASTGRVEFIPALIDNPADSAAMQARVRRRVLLAYRRRGWLDADSAANMAQWQHGGGFSVDASVVIHGHDRAGLERVLRYCARPCWASERLTRASDGERLIVTLPKPALDDRCHIILTPLELIDRLVRFIPAPRRYLHRYHGAFAPRRSSRSASHPLKPAHGRG